MPLLVSVLLLLHILAAAAELEEFQGRVAVATRDWRRYALEEWMVEMGGAFCHGGDMVDRSVPWKCAGIAMAAVMGMCLEAQSEDSCARRRSMLMKFTPTVTGGEEVSLNAAARECGLRGLSGARELGMHLECRGRGALLGCLCQAG